MLSSPPACPACGSLQFLPQGEPLSLPAILRRWQDVGGVIISDDLRQYYSTAGRETTRLHQCACCEFAMYCPPIVGSKEFYAAVTVNDYYVGEKWDFNQALAELQSMGMPHVLDVGCGSGHFLNLLKSNGIIAAGYEFNHEAAEVARANGHNVLSDVELASIDDSFDAICTFQVLEHLAEPLSFLKTINGLLKPGGKLILSVPDAAGPIRNFPDALTEIPPHHVSRWTARTFPSCVAKVGFSLEKIAVEPLPDYLWQWYLPVMWNSGIWPAEICRHHPAAGPLTESEKIDWFTGKMRSIGMKWLPGVPGHTLYVVLVKSPDCQEQVSSHEIKERLRQNQAVAVAKTLAELDQRFWKVRQLEQELLQREIQVVERERRYHQTFLHKLEQLWRRVQRQSTIDGRS